MPHRLHMAFFLITAIFVLQVSTSQGSTDISYSEKLKGTSLTVKEALDLGSSLGCWPRYIQGNWPKPRTEIEYLVSGGPQCTSHDDEHLATSLLRKLQKEFSNTLSPKSHNATTHFIMPYIKMEHFHSTDDRRFFPQIKIDAISSRWTEEQEGFPYKAGYNGFVSFHSGFLLEDWFTFQWEPRLMIVNGNAQLGHHEVLVKLTFGNFLLRVGRQHFQWGFQAEKSSLLFGRNHAPLTAIRIGNPHPIILPWTLRYLGPFQYEFMFSRLETNRTIPNPYLFAGRISLKPHQRLELGITRGLMFGGNGAPDFFFLEPIIEFLGIRPREKRIFMIPYGDPGDSFANNFMSIDINWDLPTSFPMKVFLEIYQEDPLAFEVWEDTAVRLGFWLPRIGSKPLWQIFGEASLITDGIYGHGDFRSGLTFHNIMLGSGLGPKSIGAYSRVTRIIDNSLKIWLSIEGRIHRALENTGQPDEYRQIIELGGTYVFKKNVHLDLASGIQYIRNFDYTDGNKLGGLASLKFSHQF
jgi:hypothetical protein